MTTITVRLEAITVEKSIAAHQSIINFGSSSDAVEDEWLINAERALKRKLPESYKWFLKRYAGGKVGGEEIYSIYGIPFESAKEALNNSLSRAKVMPITG